MEKITFVTKISKSGDRLYTNIPTDDRVNVEGKIGKQVKVTIEEV